ncbi:hypothetical protein Gpo141_00007529 [Globisporangium polare]
MPMTTTSSPPAFPWDETLALVRWKQTRRGYDGDAQLVRTGFALLAPESPLLDAAEREFNVTWHRIVTEVVHFAIFQLTKAKRDDVGRPEQTEHALRLLRLALNVFATRKHSEAIAIPTNSSNLLLAAMADVLEKVTSAGVKKKNDDDELDVLLDVKHVFLYLFGLPSEPLESQEASTVPTFQLYKPPTNVFTDFMHRAFTASVQRLALRTNGSTSTEYVALVRAIVVVFQELQRSQVNKKKVFLAIAKTSLRDLIGYRHALVQLETQHGIADIASVIKLLDRIVVDALFDAEHIREFDGALVHTSIWCHADAQGNIISKSLDRAESSGSSGDSKNKKRFKKNDGASALVSYQKNLFDEIKAFLSDPAVALDLKSSAGGFMEVLVGAFALRIRAAAHTKIEDTKTDLKTSKKRAATVIATASTTYSPFKFWSELCAVSFLAFKQLADSAEADDAMPLLIKLYKSLFKALCEADIYRVTEDTDEREQFEAMETILIAFLNLVNSSESSADDALTASSLLLIQEQCQIVSSAVRCSPNLVNSSLVPIFEILGSHVMKYKRHKSSDLGVVLKSGSDCLVDLVKSYESMRLLDKFLRSSMSTESSKHASEGIYALVSHASCESVLRRAFMTLPPGQLEVLWTLFTDQFSEKYSANVSGEEHEGDVFAVGLVRFVFQLFLQEVHVTPQNKAKVASLITKTHEQLFAPLVPRLEASSKTLAFSAQERELFGLFGELLSFYDVMAVIRTETFDVILSALKLSGLTSAMKELLAVKAHSSAKKKSKKSIKNSRGLDSTGIIKLCIFWLRKSASIRHSSEVASASDADLLSIALLVVDHVIESKCWDAVAFYLPELLDVVSEGKAEQLLKELVTAYLAEEATNSVVDGPATRIVREAAFYEIRTFRGVAPKVFASLAAEYDGSSEATIESASYLFRFLLSLPEAYLDVLSCADLLLKAFAIHETIASSEKSVKYNQQSSQEALHLLFAWLQANFKRISSAVYKSSASVRKGIDAGVRFIFSQAAINDGAGTVPSGKVGAPLVGDILSFYLDEAVESDKFVSELFASLISKKESSAVNLVRSTLVVEALADLRFSGDKSFTRKVGDEENKFIEALIALLKQEELSKSLDETTSFVVLGALVKYRAATADVQSQQKQQQTKMNGQGQQLHLILSSQLGASLAKSMQAVVGDTRSREAWLFYVNFCHHFAAFRPSVTVETYGCLLAVALSLVTKTGLSALEAKQAHRALQALVLNSNKDEYRLLLSTLAKEVCAPESTRAVSALKALCLLLQGERKLSSARREYLNQHKDAIVAALIQNFSRSLASNANESAVSKSEKAELCTWNLQVFVLFYGKAELFTWKTHELAHIFIGFQPLLVATSQWKASNSNSSSIFTASQVHQIWMLSYTLLLRIVRHHFASLVNGTPHLIQATNALLELLVVASKEGEASGFHATQFVEWSSNLARLYGYMKEHDSQLRKHVVYLMLTYLLSVTRDSLSVGLQQKLRPGVFSLLDICSTYEKEQLYAALDSTGKSLLKSLDANYKLTHRFAGKV